MGGACRLTEMVRKQAHAGSDGARTFYSNGSGANGQWVIGALHHR